jgi:predicted enzyme related to lactoylglutathione lyase
VAKGKVGQVAIYVEDLESAIDDFSYAFGIEFTIVQATELDLNVAVSDGGIVLVGKEGSATRDIEKSWHGNVTAVEIQVDDLAEARRRMEERGSTRLYGIDSSSGFHEHYMTGPGFGQIPVTIFEIAGESWVDAIGAGGDSSAQSEWTWTEPTEK